MKPERSKLTKEICALLDKHPKMTLGNTVAVLTYIRDGLNAYIEKPKKKRAA